MGGIGSGRSARLAAALATVCLALAGLGLAACSAPKPAPQLTAKDTIGPNGPISWSEAQARIGEQVTAEGPVTSVTTAGGDVLLNLGADAPDPSRLVVLIPSSAKARFAADPKTAYVDQLVLVVGTVEERDGVATIVVKSPADLKTE